MTAAVIERKLVGGTCVNVGCTPTKTMVASARAAHVARHAAEYGVVGGGPVSVDMRRVKARADAVTRKHAPRPADRRGSSVTPGAGARTPVVFITAARTVDTAIEAMKRGAFNYLHKPLDLGQLQDVIGEALEFARRMRSPVVLTETDRVIWCRIRSRRADRPLVDSLRERGPFGVLEPRSIK